jgi:hypothetical protein
MFGGVGFRRDGAEFFHDVNGVVHPLAEDDEEIHEIARIGLGSMRGLHQDAEEHEGEFDPLPLEQPTIDIGIESFLIKLPTPEQVHQKVAIDAVAVVEKSGILQGTLMSQEDRLNGANQRQILGESAGFTKCAADKNITVGHIFLFLEKSEIDQFGGDHGPAFRQQHEQEGNLGDVPLGVAQPLPGGLEAFELDLRPKLEQSFRLAYVESDVGGIVSSLKDEQGVSDGVF